MFHDFSYNAVYTAAQEQDDDEIVIYNQQLKKDNLKMITIEKSAERPPSPTGIRIEISVQESWYPRERASAGTKPKPHPEAAMRQRMSDQQTQLQIQIGRTRRELYNAVKQVNTAALKAPKSPTKQTVAPWSKNIFDNFESTLTNIFKPALPPALQCAGPLTEDLHSLYEYKALVLEHNATTTSHCEQKATCLTIADAFAYSAAVADGHGAHQLADSLIDGALLLMDDALDFQAEALSLGATFLAGALNGFGGLPSKPLPGFEKAYRTGQILGATIGIGVDGAAILSGLAGAGGSAAMGVSSLGALAIPATALATASTGMVVAGGAAAAAHWDKIQNAQNRFLNEATSLEDTRPPSPGRARNRVWYEKYRTHNRQIMERPHIEDPALNRFMDSMWKPNAEVGNGSTAAAARLEKQTGLPVKNKMHIQKAQNSVDALKRWLRNNPNARPGDIAAAENVLADLVEALGQK